MFLKTLFSVFFILQAYLKLCTFLLNVKRDEFGLSIWLPISEVSKNLTSFGCLLIVALNLLLRDEVMVEHIYCNVLHGKKCCLYTKRGIGNL